MACIEPFPSFSLIVYTIIFCFVAPRALRALAEIIILLLLIFVAGVCSPCLLYYFFCRPSEESRQ